MMTRLGVNRNDPANAEKIHKEVSAIVEVVNKNLLTYQRISKVTILPEPLEMTTTKKVKRNYNK